VPVGDPVTGGLGATVGAQFRTEPSRRVAFLGSTTRVRRVVAQQAHDLDASG
jgi:hypothetical protein